MMKNLLILTAAAWVIPSSFALRQGLIRIPKELSDETTLEKVLGADGAGHEFGRLDKRHDSLNAFRELFYDSELSMSMSMSLPPVPPPPVKQTTSAPAASPLPSTDDPLDVDPGDSATGAPSASPIPFGGSDGAAEEASKAVSQASATSSAPQVAMLSLLSLAAVAVVAALIARKVYVNRKAAAAEGKSLSGDSAEHSMDPSATEQGTEAEAEPLQSTSTSPTTNDVTV